MHADVQHISSIFVTFFTSNRKRAGLGEISKFFPPQPKTEIRPGPLVGLYFYMSLNMSRYLRTTLRKGLLLIPHWDSHISFAECQSQQKRSISAQTSSYCDRTYGLRSVFDLSLPISYHLRD